MAKDCWRLWDPQVGISLWWTKDDALNVAQYRRSLCRIEKVQTQRGDVVSRLGAPDTKIRED